MGDKGHVPAITFSLWPPPQWLLSMKSMCRVFGMPYLIPGGPNSKANLVLPTFSLITPLLKGIPKDFCPDGVWVACIDLLCRCQFSQPEPQTSLAIFIYFLLFNPFSDLIGTLFLFGAGAASLCVRLLWCMYVRIGFSKGCS